MLPVRLKFFSVFSRDLWVWLHLAITSALHGAATALHMCKLPALVRCHSICLFDDTLLFRPRQPLAHKGFSDSSPEGFSVVFEEEAVLRQRRVHIYSCIVISFH